MERDIAKMNTNKSIPFWSINGALTVEALTKQIYEMKDAGMGGFFFHARGGLQTEYMSEEWFEMLSASIAVAEKIGLDVWLYDENGWPSGFGGGKLLREENFVGYLDMQKKDFFDERANAVYANVNGAIARVNNKTLVAEYYCIYIKHNFSYVDILNPRVTDEFIKSAYEVYYNRYKDKFGKSIKGFFTDEPQYYRNATPWSDTLIYEFKNEYGYDVFDNLIALFLDCPGCNKFRNDYWCLVNKLYTNSYIKRIHEWCSSHNCMITGHTIEETSLYGQMMACAGVMPFYEYEDIPGIDYLTRAIGSEIAAKQLDSVCAQFGKTRAISETFGASGHATTPKQLKLIAELQYVAGVNMMCQHLLPYSIKGARKRDYPPFFSSVTKWNTESEQFNDYFAKLGFNLSQKPENVDILIIHPLRSAYLHFNRDHPEYLYPLEESFLNITEQLCARHIPHHFGDESIMQSSARVEKNRIIIGKCEYSKVILPNLDNISSFTMQLLKEFKANGGQVLVIGKSPAYVDGISVSSVLESNCSLEELAKNNIIQIQSEHPAYLKSTLRGNFLFIVSNSQTETFSAQISLKDVSSIKRYDLINEQYAAVDYKKQDNKIVFDAIFYPYTSYCYVINEGDCKIEPVDSSVKCDITSKFKMVLPYENYLPLDFAAYSTDGVNYSEVMPIANIQDKLCLDKFSGNIELKTSFYAKDNCDFNNLSIAIEHIDNQKVFCNGVEAILTDKKVIESCFDVYNLKNCKSGQNEISVWVNYFQAENVYHVLFDDGVTETLKNSLTLDTELETMFLLGNFLVSGNVISEFENYSKFEKLKIEKLDDVNIKNITTTLPFANNIIKLAAEVEIHSTQVFLELNYTVDAVKIVVNGKTAKVNIIDNRANISQYVVNGKNKIELQLFLSSQNLFGAHHFTNPNSEVTTPYNFGYGHYGTPDELWTNSYYIKNQGINKIELIES